MCDVRSDCFLSISEIRTPTIHPIPVNPSFLHSSLLSSKYPSTGFHSFPQFPSFHSLQFNKCLLSQFIHRGYFGFLFSLDLCIPRE